MFVEGPFTPFVFAEKALSGGSSYELGKLPHSDFPDSSDRRRRGDDRDSEYFLVTLLSRHDIAADKLHFGESTRALPRNAARHIKICQFLRQ
jgi:hypothetical protein